MRQRFARQNSGQRARTASLRATQATAESVRNSENHRKLLDPIHEVLVKMAVAKLARLSQLCGRYASHVVKTAVLEPWILPAWKENKPGSGKKPVPGMVQGSCDKRCCVTSV